MANSSWTAEHVRRLFLSWAPPARVYPPCDTADLAALPLERKLKRLYIVSLAQVPAVVPACHSIEPLSSMYSFGFLRCCLRCTVCPPKSCP
jgi:hypothetical protein